MNSNASRPDAAGPTPGSVPGATSSATRAWRSSGWSGASTPSSDRPSMPCCAIRWRDSPPRSSTASAPNEAPDDRRGTAAARRGELHRLDRQELHAADDRPVEARRLRARRQHQDAGHRARRVHRARRPARAHAPRHLCEAADLPRWVRFSGPGPYITPDIDDVGFMSISIKLMGVPGPKLMDEEKHTLDMFGVSTPTFVTPDAKANAALQKSEREERADLLLREPARPARARPDHAVALHQDPEQPLRGAVLQLRALPDGRGPGDAVLGLAHVEASARPSRACRCGRRTTTCATRWSRRWPKATSSWTCGCRCRPTRT